MNIVFYTAKSMSLFHSPATSRCPIVTHLYVTIVEKKSGTYSQILTHLYKRTFVFVVVFLSVEMIVQKICTFIYHFLNLYLS